MLTEQAGAYPGPRQAIIEYLSAPYGELIRRSSSRTGSWESSLNGPGGQDANPHSVRFIKGCRRPGHELHFVLFNTRAGDQRRFVVGVVQV